MAKRRKKKIKKVASTKEPKVGISNVNVVNVGAGKESGNEADKALKRLRTA